MKKIAMALLGLPLLPSCQMDPTQASSLEKASTRPVAEDVQAFVQALKEEKFEQAQSMVQAGKISVNEKVDISALSELAEVRAAAQVAALFPLQVAAYWDDASLLQLIWEQDPACYTKQDIDLALAVATSQANSDAIDFFEEAISKNFPDAGSSPAPAAGNKVPADTTLAPIQEEAVAIEEEDRGKLHKDPEDDTGKMQKDEEDTGKMQKDEDDTGKLQKDEDDTGKLQKDEDDTGKMQKDEEDTGKMQKDEDDTGKLQKDEDDTGKMQKDAEVDTGKMQKDAKVDTGKMQAEDVQAFVQALKEEKFEQAQSMVQAGKISVNEKVDISALSELAEVRAAAQVAALFPLQVAAYWDDASLLQLIWEQDPACYTKQDIDLALAVAESQANLDAIDFFEETISKNFPGEGSSPAPAAGSEVPAGTALAPIQEGAVDADEYTGTMQKDEHTGTMQKDEYTGTMQKDEYTGTMQKDEHTGTMQKDEYTGTMQKDEYTGTMQKDEYTGTMQKDEHTGTMQKDTE